MADVLAIRQNLREILCAEDVTKCRLSQQPSRSMSVLDVCHRDCRVRHSVINDGVHAYRHWVFRQYLLACIAIKHALEIYVSSVRHIMRQSAKSCATLTLNLTFKLKINTSFTPTLRNVNANLIFLRLFFVVNL